MGVSRRAALASALLTAFSSFTISQELKTGYAGVDGRNIYYEIGGRGEAIVLLHGFSLDHRIWDPQVDDLTRSYRVLRYDLSGYGRSDIPDSSISAPDELAALLEFVGIRKAALVGMSMGGGVAVNFAIEYPEKVSALITVGSTLDGYAMHDPARSRMRQVITVARDSGLPKARELWLSDPLLTPVTHTDSLKTIIRHIVADWSGAQFMKSTFADFLPLHPSAISRLNEIGAPTLVIVGEHDDPNMHAIADTLAAGIPGAKKRIIAGSGHLVNLERPEEFTRIIREFLAEHGLQ